MFDTKVGNLERAILSGRSRVGHLGRPILVGVDLDLLPFLYAGLFLRVTMSEFTIYHNPRCSKSRQALQLLRDANVEPEIVLYLESPLSESQLTELIQLLGVAARQLIRKSEAEYKSLGLNDASLTEQQLIKAMVEHPKLIERPIVVAGQRAVVARPPERVNELL